jgi:hypothetical protein
MFTNCKHVCELTKELDTASREKKLPLQIVKKLFLATFATLQQRSKMLPMI